MARVDPEVPIETSIRALGELVDGGKIGSIGLGEVSASTIRRAHAVRPGDIACVEIELSLFTPDALRNDVLETCRERERTIQCLRSWMKLTCVVSIPVIAYSPLGRGSLSATYKSLCDLSPTDYRRRMPRFQPGVFEQNVKLSNAVEELARRKGVAASQVAIGWVVKLGAIPIPGSCKAERVKLNCEPADLGEEDMEELRGLVERFPVVGERYGVNRRGF